LIRGFHHKGCREGKRKKISPQRVQRGKEEKDFTTEHTEDTERKTEGKRKKKQKMRKRNRR